MPMQTKRKMLNNPQYLRLRTEKGFAIKRITTEYLPAGEDRWQLEPIAHDPDLTVKLAIPPTGINRLKRPRL